jgi:antitoxin YefM
MEVRYFLHGTSQETGPAFMNAVTLNDAKLNLEQLIESTLENAEPTIICTDRGQRVVFLPLDEFNSWKESLYLLSNPVNAAHLRRSILEADAGKVNERELLDQ